MCYPVRCFFRTKSRWNGSTFPSEGGECGTPYDVFSVLRPYVAGPHPLPWEGEGGTPLCDVFSALRPDGLGPHFLLREGECGTPCTMFFPY